MLTLTLHKLVISKYSLWTMLDSWEDILGKCLEVSILYDLPYTCNHINDIDKCEYNIDCK